MLFSFETKNKTDSSKVAHPNCSEGTSTHQRNAVTDNQRAIDSVFTGLGFDVCFLDDAHPFKMPNLKMHSLKKPRVLHIDDDSDLVDAVTSRLKASGYRVSCALDGVTGMETALLYGADAIILDYDMPNGRGDAVIDLLKDNDQTSDIPIVVLTAVEKKDLKREMLSKGADEFMTKPFEYSELQSTIADLIARDRD